MKRIGQPRKVPTMVDAIKDIWPMIGNDILQGEDSDNPVLTGEEVADIVADYVETYLDHRLIAEYRNASWEQRKAWRAEAFPKTERYGF